MHAITGLSSGQIIFAFLGSIFGLLFGLFFMEIRPFGFCFFLIFTNPTFGFKAILIILILSKV